MNDAETGVETDTRLKRPTPARQAPLRRPPLGLPASMGATLNGALDAARESSQALSSGLGAAVRQGLDSGQAVGEAVEVGMQGFVERGVNTAYQVIEAYMQRGQEAAQRLSPRGPEPAHNGLAADAASAWARNLTGPIGQTASSLAGPWMQLARAWVDGLSTLAPMAGQVAGQVAERMAGQMAGQAAGQAAGPLPGQTVDPFGDVGTTNSGAPSAIHPAGPRAKVTLEFMSGQPADVAVTLEPGADLAALQARWSDATVEGETAAVPGSVVLYSAPGHVHVRLTLAQAPVAGRHVATLVDSQGQCWGSVSVVIAQRAASHLDTETDPPAA